MSFNIEKQDNYTLIKFSTNKLDAIVAPDLKSELVVISKKGEKNIIIDLDSVKYCDSSGLSALLIGDRVCKGLNGSLILSCLQPSVYKLIAISQLDSILTIKKTTKEAVNSLFIEEIERNLGAQ